MRPPSTARSDLASDQLTPPSLRDVISELVEQAKWQHGLLTLAQIEAAGHRHLVRQRLQNGEWVERQPCVVSSAGWEPSLEAQLTAVRLSVAARGPADGWCFSHTTAAHLLQLKVPEPTEVHVLLPISRTRLQLDDVVRHFTRQPVSAAHVRLEPVTRPSLTVLQCATVLAREDLQRLVEDALRTGRAKQWQLRELCGRGTSGSRALGSVLDEVVHEGLDRWMRRLVRLLVAAGLPRPALEVPLYDGDVLRAVLDGLYEDAKLALEVDDWETHSSRRASERDRQRDRWVFKTYGILTLRFTPREIRERPERVVADICEAYRQRLPRRPADQVSARGPQPPPTLT